MRHLRLLPITLLFTFAGCGQAPNTPAPAANTEAGAQSTESASAFAPITSEGARVFFASPAEGAEVTSPVTFTFGADNLEIVKAGVNHTNSGHHHLILDGAPIPAGEVVPADATHIHYGGAQTEASVELAPGAHTLTMQLADGQHRSYGPDFAATLHITVVESAAAEAPDAQAQTPAAEPTP